MWDAVESKDKLVALFTDVLKCERCPAGSVKHDSMYNIPQPGWVGRSYSGVMFVGQNPGEGQTPPTNADRAYLDALRNVNDLETLNAMHDQLKAATDTFVYYRSFHFESDIERVAYINVVRCRTGGNSVPEDAVRRQCRRHFLEWVRCLKPRAVIYLGLFAERATSDLLKRLGIKYKSISRQRNLPAELRESQHAAARQLIESTLS